MNQKLKKIYPDFEEHINNIMNQDEEDDED